MAQRRSRLRVRQDLPADDPLEEVIVTGSRWWLDPTQAVAPVTVLDRRDIERGGESSVGDVLQALPMTTGSPLNTNVNAPSGSEPRTVAPVAGDGSIRFSIHDLPTVVLLNGRRLPSSGLGADASVDLNTLPMSFIERVEVLAGGASAAVGADAVGGVVNIVTRRAIMALNSVERGRSLNAAMGRSSPDRRRSASTCSAERGASVSTTSSRTASRWIGAATPLVRS